MSDGARLEISRSRVDEHLFPYRDNMQKLGELSKLEQIKDPVRDLLILSVSLEEIKR